MMVSFYTSYNLSSTVDITSYAVKKVSLNELRDWKIMNILSGWPVM